MDASTNPECPAPRSRRLFNAWIDRTLAACAGGPRYDYTTGRRADPNSPENVWLREQYEARGAVAEREAA